MKVISGLLKFAAYILMIIFVIAFPVSLLGRGIARTIFSTEGFVQSLAQDLVNADVFASIAEGVVEGMQQDLDVQSREEQYFFGVMSNLDHDDWIEVVELVAPSDLLEQTTDEFINGFYGWLNGPDPVPEIEIDMREWKHSIQTATVPVMEIVLDALPNCSASEIEYFSTGEEIPFCKLPEPYYSDLLVATSSDMANRLSETPDVYSFADSLLQEDGASQSFERIKQRLLTARSILSTSWLVILAAYLIAIPLGARSLQGAFSWGGWPMVISGIFTLILSLLIFLFGGGAVSIIGRAASELPVGLSTPFTAALGGIITIIGRPLLIQALVQLFVGGIAVVFSLGLGRIAKQNDMQESHEGDDLLSEEPDQTPATKDNDGAYKDDDSSPSGMFG